METKRCNTDVILFLTFTFTLPLVLSLSKLRVAKMSFLMKQWRPSVRRSLSSTRYRSSDRFCTSTRSEFVNHLEIVGPLNNEKMKTYRVMDRSGKVLNAEDDVLTKDQALKMYKEMMKVWSA